MKICVLGLGYIGLPTSLLLAQHHQVIGIDINHHIVNQLNHHQLPFNEPDLEQLLSTTHNNFHAATTMEPADAFIIAVPTPLEGSMKIADLTYVRNAAEMIYPHLTEENLVILESTVPPGTSQRIILPILKKSNINHLYYAHCPERAIPGQTIHEMIHNDRIIGGIDALSTQRTKELYSSFVQGEMFLTNSTTAEFIKLMENTYRDVNIALANELAQIADENHIDIWESIKIANKHPRVNILKPGPGVGGHCIAIDPWFLTEQSTKFRIISLARQINDNMPNIVFQLVRKLLYKTKEATITILGVAYKGNVDDARETPATKFIRLAKNEGYTIKIHDPYVKDYEHPILDLTTAITNSDCIVLLTDHTIFTKLDPNELGSLMRKRILVDTRNILDHYKWKNAGFTVEVLGKPSDKNQTLS